MNEINFLKEVIDDAMKNIDDTNPVAKKIMQIIKTDELFNEKDKIEKLIEEMVH